MRPVTLWIALVFCYPIIFIVSSILSFFVKIPSATISENQLVKTLNKCFVEYGYIPFTISYFASAVQRSGYCLKDKAVYVSEAFRKYILLTLCAIIFNVWFLGLLLFERIDELAGGHCALPDNPSKKISQRHCLNMGFEWISYFDLSGHFYILTSMSFALAYQILSGLHDHNVSTISDFIWATPNVHESSTDADVPTGSSKAVYKIKIGEVFSQTFVAIGRISSLFLITVWMLMFAITGIFFHTFWEKALLLILSLGLSVMILGEMKERRYSGVEW